MGMIEKLSSLLKRGELSSKELTKKYLDAIKGDNPTLNAYVNVTEEEALSRAQKADEILHSAGDKASPLTGIPMGLKDNICTRGIKTTCCSEMLRNHTPIYDATVWQRLKSQGAVLLGKTNMDEFAMGSSGDTSCFKGAKNPFDTARSTGGSSSGSAAAVAGNLAVYTLGSDTGGSVRQPASFCGAVGLKPTYGAVSRNGLVAFASSLDQIGPMAMSVEDVSLVFDAIGGYDPMDSTSKKDYTPNTYKELKKDIKGKRLAVVREFYDDVTQEVAEAVKASLKIFENLGADIEIISVPSVHFSLPAYYILACAEASSNLARYDGARYGFRTKSEFDSINEMMTKSRSEAFGEEVKRRIMLGTYVLSHGYYDEYYKKAQMLRHSVIKGFEKVFEKFDAIVTPTSPTTAFKRGALLTDPTQAYKADICTVPANIAGLPAVSLPCGYDKKGLPIGLQIIGNKFCDAQVLSLAYNFQQTAEVAKTTDMGVSL